MKNPVTEAKIWSATPTPLTPNLQVDVPSVQRMVDRHLKIGVSGLMLGGTCGEGPIGANLGYRLPWVTGELSASSPAPLF